MARYMTVVLAAATLLGLAAPTQAQSEHVQQLLGTWTRKTDGCKVKLRIKPEVLRCTLTIEEGYAITVEADYVVSKDGILLGIVRAPKAEKPAKDEDDALSKRLFYLQVSADGKGLVVSNVNCEDNGDDKVKEVLEGRYHRAESKSRKAATKAARTPTPYLQCPPNYCAPQPKPSPTKAPEAPKLGEPRHRLSERLKVPEDLGKIQTEWERIWSADNPSHLTPERIRGGIPESAVTDWHFLWQYFQPMLPEPPQIIF